jgi:hypothetical protein
MMDAGGAGEILATEITEMLAAPAGSGSTTAGDRR